MNNIYVFGMFFNVLNRFALSLIGKSILDGLTNCLYHLKPHNRMSIYNIYIHYFKLYE